MSTNSNHNPHTLINIGFILLSVLLFLRLLFDADFGWHLMVGKYIVENLAIPQTDIFTFSAPDYVYVYHSWLSEVVLYLIYNFAGLWGVTLFYAVIGAAILWIMLTTIQLQTRVSWIYYYLLLIISLILDATNLRIQLLSFLGLSLVYYIYRKWLIKGGNTLYYIPVIFIIWVNLHAGFLVGLLFLGLILIIEIFKICFTQVKSFEFWGLTECLPPPKLVGLMTVIGLSILSSLINPYHFRAYHHAWLMGTNQFALTFNSDWYPIVRADAPETFIYTALLFTALILILSIKHKLDLREKLLIAIFFLLSLKNRRFVVPLLVVLMPSFPLVFSNLRTNFVLLLKPIWPINKLLIPILILVIFTPALIWIPRLVVAYQNQAAYTDQIQKFSTQVFYPYHAVEYLKQNPIPERILNDFNWGGYLVWQIPGIKTFIDGRMDNFIINGESFAKQYLTIVNLMPGWEDLMEKYQFDTVFLATHHPIVAVLRILPEWKLVYEDDIAVIFQKST